MRFCFELVLGAAVVLSSNALLAGENSAPISTVKAVSVVRADVKTGRLVRSVVVPRKPAAKQSTDAAESDPGAGFRSLAHETAKNLDVSPELVDSVIQVESNYNPYAISPKGAEGLMQLMPSTARRFGVQDSFDPRQNIEGGVRYLKFLKEQFKDDRLAIAAYNAGEKAVTRYGSVPPYRETVNYVEKVGQKYNQAKKAVEAQEKKVAATKPASETLQTVQEARRHVVGYVDEEGRLHIATR